MQNVYLLFNITLHLNFKIALFSISGFFLKPRYLQTSPNYKITFAIFSNLKKIKLLDIKCARELREIFFAQNCCEIKVLRKSRLFGFCLFGFQSPQLLKLAC